jgi:hypothetical protein
MNGGHAAFEGRIGKDAEVRGTRDGKPWASFPLADTKADSHGLGGATKARCTMPH